MRKLNLAALYSDRDRLLNILQETNAVEIKEHPALDGTAPLEESVDDLRAYHASLEAALETLENSAEAAKKEQKLKIEEDGFPVTYREFAAARELREHADEVVAGINMLLDMRAAASSEEVRLARAIQTAKPYANLFIPFSSFAPTRHTVTKLGTLSASAWDSLKRDLDEIPLVACEETRTDDSVLLTLVVHRSVLEEIETLLAGAGFAPCPYSGDETGEALMKNLTSQMEDEQLKKREAEMAIVELSKELKPLRLYADFVGFELEKAEAAGMMRGTERTFFLEAFVPADEEAAVSATLDEVPFALWYEFSDPAEDESVPTLLKNNPLVRGFETITNTYSPPSAREFDPNAVMGFFYSLFLGFIMGDTGYGLLMVLFGSVIALRARKGSAMRSLASVFAIGGVFAIGWGFLFNSTFGISFFSYKIMPEVREEMYTLMGVKIPGMLIVAMLVGIVHLFAGYLCRAVQAWRRKQVLDGLFEGLTWAIFSLGVGIALSALIDEFHLPAFLLYIGGGLAGAGLLVAVLTAGRKEKIIGKFTKGFGSLYGVINYVSDVLSYARLYGLMLSGAVVAQIVSQYALTGVVDSATGEIVTVGMIQSGNIAYIILGAVLMLVGHLFNLAIGLLGAYIHDARLQYVEFYGRFFEGEGELFTPLGSKCKHVLLSR